VEPCIIELYNIIMFVSLFIRFVWCHFLINCLIAKDDPRDK